MREVGGLLLAEQAGALGRLVFVIGVVAVAVLQGLFLGDARGDALGFGLLVGFGFGLGFGFGVGGFLGLFALDFGVFGCVPGV